MNVTLDGFIAGPNCELDWHFNFWNEEMAKFAREQLSRADTILLGRVTYKAMANYWPAKAMDLSYAREDIAFACMMNSYAKIVFSKTLENIEWNNSRLIKNDIRKEILKLKRRQGKDIIIYGSGSIVSTLMQLGLIDEYVLWLHPVFIGKGKTLFSDPDDRLNLKLVNTKTLGSGVIILYCMTTKRFDLHKTLQMEKYFLKDNIKVFYVTAKSFPNGVMAAYQKLHSLLPSTKDRKFYGISYPGENGTIIYKAAVEESQPGEAEKYGCDTFTIPKGEYISELLTDWKKDETIIGKTFKKLIAHPKIDKNGFCLEMYLNDKDMRCLVSLESGVDSRES